MMQIVKDISGMWTGTVLMAARSEHPQQPWRHLVLLLASLQSFANSLPAPMKARARELVAAELVPVIQARATGRTYSMRHQQDVYDSLENSADVMAACRLVCGDARLRALLEMVVDPAEVLTSLSSRPPLGVPLTGVKRCRTQGSDDDGTPEQAYDAECESKLSRVDS
jgi:hypothetical protein